MENVRPNAVKEVKEDECNTNNKEGKQSMLFAYKYKPTTIDNFFSSKGIKNILKTLLKIDDLNILLIGDACCGKTTLLNVLIREYYELNSGGSIPEHNILHINNLKEQGIGYFRNEMKTFCQSHSIVAGKKKMIVIDDIDTVNEQSQQVVRNYMDKYKNNVHFTFVCTNIQKVIESLQSRVHIIKIDSPTQMQIKELMDFIIKKEGLKMNNASKKFILKHSNNSIRTMINFIEKIHVFIGGDVSIPITEKMCIELCSDIKMETFELFLNHIKNGELKKAIEIIYKVHDYELSVIDILELFFVFVKMTNILTETEKYEIIKLISKYITIFYSVHEDVIELALFSFELHQFFNSVNSVNSVNSFKRETGI